MRSVLIIQEHLPAFRCRFYELLRRHLIDRGVALEVVFAPNQSNTFLQGELDWVSPVPIVRLGPVAWQPVVRRARRHDLVILQQETKYLVNPLLQATRRFGSYRVAYWGHGRNFQTERPNSTGERLKRWLSKRVDWWFAYNDLSARVIRGFGYPAERITSVGNAVDTSGMRDRLVATTVGDLKNLSVELGIESKNVAVFTGGFYHQKRLGFLLDAADLIREEVPDFHLLMIGAGPEEEAVRNRVGSRPWVHLLGKKSELGKVPYWALSKLLLMPGLVGLVVVDSFALETPMVTTDYPFHSPEIDYLVSGENGLMVPGWEDPNAYASEVVALMRDEDRLDRLRAGARKAASVHTIERMAENFATGVLASLEAPPYGS